MVVTKISYLVIIKLLFISYLQPPLIFFHTGFSQKVLGIILKAKHTLFARTENKFRTVNFVAAIKLVYIDL
jgi:hypothetical protein